MCGRNLLLELFGQTYRARGKDVYRYEEGTHKDCPTDCCRGKLISIRREPRTHNDREGREQWNNGLALPGLRWPISARNATGALRIAKRRAAGRRLQEYRINRQIAADHLRSGRENALLSAASVGRLCLLGEMTRDLARVVVHACKKGRDCARIPPMALPVKLVLLSGNLLVTQKGR